MTQIPSGAPDFPTQENRKSFFQRNVFLVKAALIGILTLLLLIPLSMVEGLVHERQSLSLASRHDITERWSEEQTVVGPAITFICRENEETDVQGEKNVRHVVKKRIELLPEDLKIKADVGTTALRRGIYEVTVYRSKLILEGSFRLSQEQRQQLARTCPDTTDCRLSLGLSDLRGLEKQVGLQWDGRRADFVPNNENGLLSGLSTPIDPGALLGADRPVPFRIELELKGSNALYFIPLGGTTSVSIESDCPTPSFTGNFLPSARQVRDDGFSGEWNILGMNRPYPQLLEMEARESAIEQSRFGVELLMPVAQYQMSIRAIKYGALIILLTFVAMLFAETLFRGRLNPLQYLLVGLALVLFYSLLIALCEHLSFGLSYALAACMTLALLAWYTYAILREKKAAWGIGVLLAGLYFYIFVLLQMETWALLAGSLGLFVILGGVMFLSQKINTIKDRR